MKSVLEMLVLHLQEQSGEQFRLALIHLHLVQLPLQEHLTSSLHVFETSGSVGAPNARLQTLLGRESLAAPMCRWSRFQLDTVPVECVEAEHLVLVVFCP